MGYCDVHCHILPGLDDGAKDMKEALEMVEIAKKSGITDIIFTPHYKIGRCEPSKDKIKDVINKLNEQLIDENIKFYVGTEIMFSEDCIELLDKEQIFSLNNSKYVLVEFRPADSVKYIKESLYKIICTGYTPVLAHIERYNSFIESYDDIDEIVEMGAYIQVNADSVIGKYGSKIKKFIKMLMKYDMLHFIGTDAHGSDKRTPDIEKCAKYIEKKFGKEYRDELLINNPKKYFNI